MIRTAMILEAHRVRCPWPDATRTDDDDGAVILPE
jgi:hypothetical protein